jgi:hypothetical protein
MTRQSRMWGEDTRVGPTLKEGLSVADTLVATAAARRACTATLRIAYEGPRRGGNKIEKGDERAESGSEMSGEERKREQQQQLNGPGYSQLPRKSATSTVRCVSHALIL